MSTTQNNPDIRPVKVISCNKAELERIQNEFKAYWPTQKNIRVAAAPRENENWQLYKTLPSGLYLGDKENEKLHGFLPTLLGKKSKDRDYRLYQYEVERHQHENPWLAVQHRTTYSISWHPTKDLLVTSGDGGLVKLWNTESGELITVSPFWQSEQDGRPTCWSHDGDVFAGAKYIFDGKTGENLYTEHRNDQGDRLRLPSVGSKFDDYHYPSRYKNAKYTSASSYNFSPWRPHSNQYVIHNFESSVMSNKWVFDPWTAHSSGRGWMCLVFRNNRTGEVEKVIDCDAVLSHMKRYNSSY